MITLGNTKAGKSSLLNEIIGGDITLNTGASKETAFMWRISFSEAFTEQKMSLTYEEANSKKKEHEDFNNIDFDALQRKIS